MDNYKCPKCGSNKIVGHNIVYFKGKADYYCQDHNCFKCKSLWRNFYKIVLDSQQQLNPITGELIENAP